MRVRRILKWGLAAVIAVPVVLVLGAFALLYTDGGSRWLVGRVLERLGDTVTVGQFEGRLWDRFRIADVRVNAPPAIVAIGDVEIRWRLARARGSSRRRRSHRARGHGHPS